MSGGEQDPTFLRVYEVSVYASAYRSGDCSCVKIRNTFTLFPKTTRISLGCYTTNIQIVCTSLSKETVGWDRMSD